MNECLKQKLTSKNSWLSIYPWLDYFLSLFSRMEVGFFRGLYLWIERESRRTANSDMGEGRIKYPRGSRRKYIQLLCPDCLTPYPKFHLTQLIHYGGCIHSTCRQSWVIQWPRLQGSGHDQQQSSYLGHSTERSPSIVRLTGTRWYAWGLLLFVHFLATKLFPALVS